MERMNQGNERILISRGREEEREHLWREREEEIRQKKEIQVQREHEVIYQSNRLVLTS